MSPLAAGANPVEACTYDFPVTDPKTFVATGNVFEGVGDSAYLGAAAKISNKKYLTDAGAILSTEARHNSYFRAESGEIPFTPFGTPLGFDEVYTIVSPFIVSCPSSNGKLPVKAFPSLTMTSGGSSVMPGSTVTLHAGNGYKMSSTNVHAAFITVTGPVWANVQPKGNGQFSVTVPKGILGQSYVVLTQGDKKVSDDNICAGPAIIQVGPIVGTPSCSGNGSGISMSMPSGGAMPTSSMPSIPSGSMMSWSSMSTGSMATSSMMPSGSSSSSTPMFTGGAGKKMGNAAGAIGASLMAAAFAI